VLKDCDWGTHWLLDPPEYTQLQSENETSIAELADFVGRTLSGSWHVVGISMGGIIAQSLADWASDRILSLNLCCTNTGGYNNPFGVNPMVQKLWFQKASAEEDPVLKILRPCFSPKALDSGLLEEYAQHIRLSPNQPSGRILKLQWQAMTRFGSQDFLYRLKMPVHLYYGIQDEVVGYSDYHRLKNLLPLASTQEFCGGHMFFLESRVSFLKVLHRRIVSNQK